MICVQLLNGDNTAFAEDGSVKFCESNMSTVLIMAGWVLRLPCVELRALRIRCIGPTIFRYMLTSILFQ